MKNILLNVVCCVFWTWGSMDIARGDTEVVIAHGVLVKAPENFTLQGSHSAIYDVVETTSGAEDAGHINISYYADAMSSSLPPEAILLLTAYRYNGGSNAMYRVLSDEPSYGILPYSERAWEEMLSKPGDELLVWPINEQIGEESAHRVFSQYIMREMDNPPYVYMFPGIRDSFAWSMFALVSYGTGLLEVRSSVTDTGRLVPIDIRHVVRFSPQELDGEKLDEVVAQAVANYSSGFIPEYWPFRIQTPSDSLGNIAY